jgi:cyclopropane-fatty-acyl-phospholipid synthase
MALTDPAARIIGHLARRLRSGSLVVEGPGGGWTVGSGDPIIRITVRDQRFYGAVLRRGSEGLGQSYAAGWWEADDLTGLVRLLLQNLTGPIDLLDRVVPAMSGPLALWQRHRRPTKEADRRNVQAHYDLPGDLFVAMLDETMTYSCAVFDKPDYSLAEAQLAKLDRICRKLDLAPGDQVVEIGTGWGSFALHAAGSYGCRVTTTTVSQAQYDVASRRVEAAGLSDRVRVLGVDYRDLGGRYDKLVSIEMIEAVDWRSHDIFFENCRRLLLPGGLMLLQAIVIADRSYERAKQHDDFIRRFVFPGGCLPSVTAIGNSLTRATDLRVFDLEDIGMHYATTLRCWLESFEDRWPQIAASGLDEKFRRLWTFYLCYCEAAFAERHLSDVQMVLAGPGFRPTAGTRRV